MLEQNVSVLPWQQKQWQRCMDYFQQQKIPHAWLLSGSAGLGVNHFAHAWAQLLVCQSPQRNSACNQCQSCRWFQESAHPDIENLILTGEQHQIKIETIRELASRLYLTSARTNYRVVLLGPVERMNTAAANALLKLLEEPPARVIFVLICHQSFSLLTTIRTRCHLIHFAPDVSNATLAWLQQQGIQDPKRYLQWCGDEPFTVLATAEQLNELKPTFENKWVAFLQHKLHATAFAEWCLKQLSFTNTMNWLFFWVYQQTRKQLEIGSPMLLPLIKFYQQLLNVWEKQPEKNNLNLQLVLESLFISARTYYISPHVAEESTPF